MPWLTQLAEIARRTGYPVTEVPGWKSRGHGPQPAVKGIVCHHTAGATAGGDYPSLRVVRDGRPGLDGPLSQFGLGRSGRIYVIAAGRCWHNAPSTSARHNNSSSLGIEAENDGRQPWPTPQLDAYQRLCAELCAEFGLTSAAVKGHKEVNRQKPDPHSLSMNDFRTAVAALIKGEPPLSWTEKLLKNLPVLRLGDDNFDVKTLRANLFARGFVPASAYSTPLDLKAWLERTDYDPQLAALVGTFQKSKGLNDDQICGPDTWPPLLR
ncbi:N-acetylmuramoyl-L-alanine amidase, partial [Nonomuraea sp. NPDC046570]|uniref:N-acetylmuramoyl-L-alanine amidase n=1 Tax=Nonomuraea sp. NPDC046570 TaxID=3155255 RepID=UPI0033FCB3F7